MVQPRRRQEISVELQATTITTAPVLVSVSLPPKYQACPPSSALESMNYLSLQVLLASSARRSAGHSVFGILYALAVSRARLLASMPGIPRPFPGITLSLPTFDPLLSTEDYLP